MVLNFFGIESEFGKVDLQSTCQPAITRVNKQVRAEALSIYYEENVFYVDIHLRDPFSIYHPRYPEVGYGDICKIIGDLVPYRGQSPSIGYPLRHIRTFHAVIFADIDSYGLVSPCLVVKLAKGETSGFMSEKHLCRLGGDETDWTDLDIVDALINQWMQSKSPDSRLAPTVQVHLIHVLQLLAANLLSDSSIKVKGSRFGGFLPI